VRVAHDPADGHWREGGRKESAAHSVRRRAQLYEQRDRLYSGCATSDEAHLGGASNGRAHAPRLSDGQPCPVHGCVPDQVSLTAGESDPCSAGPKKREPRHAASPEESHRATKWTNSDHESDCRPESRWSSHFDAIVKDLENWLVVLGFRFEGVHCRLWSRSDRAHKEKKD
jgi:hypothetical protein